MGPVHVIAGLLDTHPLLWELAGDERVPAWLREDIDRDPSRYGVSDVCLWEVAIKRSVGKLQASADLPRTIADLGFARIAITRSQVWAVGDLALHHRDPFDRLLIAQARELALPLITVDAAMSAYGVPTLW